MRDQKLHAAVARSRSGSQKTKNTTLPKRFWHSRCRTSARHCGVKNIRKSKVLKTDGPGPLLEVRMWLGVECAMILRDRRSTSYEVTSFFLGRRNTLLREIAWKYRKTHWHERLHLCTQLLPCWKSRRIASFFFDFVKFNDWRSEDISQNFSVFGAVNCHFWRKSRRIASFWICHLPLSKEASRNSFHSDR